LLNANKESRIKKDFYLGVARARKGGERAGPPLPIFFKVLPSALP
jgi:hypothetical protein